MIIDDDGSGTVLLCENHYKKISRHIKAARDQGVSVTTLTVKKRGCRFCSSDRIGYSQWSDTMFKIWKGFKKNESR